MSDSHKISLLDLQAPDLSQYGKTNREPNREPNRGVNRAADSSYRRQLSESLSKKQTNSSNDKVQEPESRSVDLKSDQKRKATQSSESRSAIETRDDQAPLEKQQRDVSPKGTTAVSEESRVEDSQSEQTVTNQEQNTPEKSETIESTEEVINPQSGVHQPANDKEQNYSLFNTSFAIQNEGAFDQEVTTVDSEIQPPGNFQFVNDQNQVNLQTEVTETGLNEAIPIPEGLADQLKKQVVQTSQTDSGQEVQAVDVTSLNQELNVVEPIDETQTEFAEGENQTSETESELLLNQISDLEMTEELKQAIEEHQTKNSDNPTGATDESEVDIQALIQQRYQRSRNDEESESSSDEANEGEIPLDQESIEQISDTVIAQLQQEPDSEQPDITEIVSESSAREAERAKQAEPQTADVAQNLVNQGLQPAAETLSQAQTESTKSAPVSQDNVASIDHDQTLSQSAGAHQSSRTTGTQSTTPVGPPVDVKQVEQLVERVVESVRQSQSTGQQLKIRLSPPELGTLQIEVSLKNGEYTAKLEVQNSRTQKVINDSIAQLKEALIKTGVSLDRIDVHINTDSTEDQRSSHSDAQSESGNDFDSNQSSENTGDSEERQQEPGYTEEGVRQEDSAEQDNPQVARSQGITTENVEEIDVQI
ncbi:flagellar hook-length control protein FliK [uncultured Gimesia sp.]|uniref:flagellar hook-length control protein FliK n=1 Tax=uncultured Gimesia sp. TaxID=1678688 RepID=UPI0030D87AA9|tara:strand:+ start:97177 stop:99126 length:1950 start_codon:yes stop_codon:yes gene_type:complete